MCVCACVCVVSMRVLCVCVLCACLCCVCCAYACVVCVWRALSAVYLDTERTVAVAGRPTVGNNPTIIGVPPPLFTITLGCVGDTGWT